MVIAILALSATAGCGGGEATSDATQAPGPPARTRIAAVRIYQHGTWTVPGETPDTVGKALAALKPTLVSGLIRDEPTEEVKDHEVDAWNKVRTRVLAASPGAHFGVELNAVSYKTPEQVEQQMQEIRAKLDNNGWFFDFFTTAYKQRPDVVEAAINSAHENGEWIGGNVFGLGHDPPVPPGTDYLASPGFRGLQDRPRREVRKLAEKVPIAFHLGNSPGDPRSSGWPVHQATGDRAARGIRDDASPPAAGERVSLRLSGAASGVRLSAAEGPDFVRRDQGRARCCRRSRG